jgi:hypothetical protein
MGESRFYGGSPARFSLFNTSLLRFLPCINQSSLHGFALTSPWIHATQFKAGSIHFGNEVSITRLPRTVCSVPGLLQVRYFRISRWIQTRCCFSLRHSTKRKASYPLLGRAETPEWCWRDCCSKRSWIVGVRYPHIAVRGQRIGQSLWRISSRKSDSWLRWPRTSRTQRSLVVGDLYWMGVEDPGGCDVSVFWAILCVIL